MCACMYAFVVLAVVQMLLLRIVAHQACESVGRYGHSPAVFHVGIYSGSPPLLSFFS